MMIRSLLCSLALYAVLAFVGSRAHAQAELDGTYIDYVGVGPNGILIDGAHSMRYSESGSSPYSCDVFYPGAPFEDYLVGFSTASLASADFTTTSPTAVSGSSITWAGSHAPISLRQTVSMGSSDRQVAIDVSMTNTGTTPLSNVTYARVGDPDQGDCDTGTTYTTNNDVRLDGTSGAALVTAGAGTPYTVIGLGLATTTGTLHAAVFDYSSMSIATIALGTDPNGTNADSRFGVSVTIPTLGAGATATFRIYYVWGSSETAVDARFASLIGSTGTCSSDGVSCRSGSSSGICHGGSCCTGCYDSATGDCLTGSGDPSACGSGGAECATCPESDGNPCTRPVCSAGRCASTETPADGASCDDASLCTIEDRCAGGVCRGTAVTCDDGLSCTTDVCDAPSGACVPRVTTGCAIAGACVGTLSSNPDNPCERCDPELSTSSWSPIPPSEAPPGCHESADDAGTTTETDAGPGGARDAGMIIGDGDGGITHGADGGASSGHGGGHRRGGCSVACGSEPTERAPFGVLLAFASVAFLAGRSRRRRVSATR